MWKETTRSHGPGWRVAHRLGAGHRRREHALNDRSQVRTGYIALGKPALVDVLSLGRAAPRMDSQNHQAPDVACGYVNRAQQAVEFPVTHEFDVPVVGIKDRAA